MAGHKSAEFWLEEIWKLGGTATGLILGAGSSLIGKVNINVTPTTPATYRSAITAADVIAPSGTVTCTKLTGVGAMTGGTYYIKVVAMNAYGRTTSVAGNTTVTTETTNLGVRAAFAAVTGATHYDIYATTAADPLWVGRVTEVQRASGIIIPTVGNTQAGGTAGAVDIYAIGTGLASSVNSTVNFAYKMPADVPIVCTGYQYCDFYADYSRTGDAVSPALTIMPFLYNSLTGKWGQAQLYTHSFGGPAGAYNSNEPVVRVELRGAALAHCLVAYIAGTGASCTLTVVLS